MKVIRIDKTKLLGEVRANREKHLAEFREVAAKYKEQLAAKLLRRMERIDKFNVDDAVERGAALPNCHVNLDIP